MKLPAADRSWMEDFSPITIAVWNYDRAAHLLERAASVARRKRSSGWRPEAP